MTNVEKGELRAKVAIENLDLTVKNSIVDLLYSVVSGYISVRRAADEIQKKAIKPIKSY